MNEHVQFVKKDFILLMFFEQIYTSQRFSNQFLCILFLKYICSKYCFPSTQNFQINSDAVIKVALFKVTPRKTSPVTFNLRGTVLIESGAYVVLFSSLTDVNDHVFPIPCVFSGQFSYDLNFLAAQYRE